MLDDVSKTDWQYCRLLPLGGNLVIITNGSMFIA